MLSKLSSQVSSPETNDVVGRVNRLLSAWPTDDTMPSEGFESLKNIYTKLNKGLNEIKSNAERDAKLVSTLSMKSDFIPSFTHMNGTGWLRTPSSVLMS